MHQAVSETAADAAAESPIECAVAATSVGIVDGEILVDLCYEEDFRADADFNGVMTDRGEYVEVQGTAEGTAFSKSKLDEVLALAERGISQLFAFQRSAVRGSAY